MAASEICSTLNAVISTVAELEQLESLPGSYVAEFRAALQTTQQLSRRCRKLLHKHGPKASTRTDFLRTVGEIVGPNPEGRTWQDEWVDLSVDFYLGCGKEDADRAAILSNKFGPSTLHDLTARHTKAIHASVDQGWTEEQATIIELLRRRRQPIARCLMAGHSVFAASVHALCKSMFDAAKQQRAGVDERSGCARWMYKHLTGLYSLADQDVSWLKLGEPDQYGFKGLTSMSPTEVNCEASNFLPEDPTGFAQRCTDHEGKVTYQVQNSPVVCFKPQPEDSSGMHAPVLLSSRDVGMYPPNTLFRLVDVQEGGFEGPNGVRISQKLYVVTATYKTPEAGTGEAGFQGKMCSGPFTLSYLARTAFIDGLNELLLSPVLTMKEEFSRDVTWTDWQGARYSLKQEWEYVTGTASIKHNCTPGDRDVDHDGWSADQFLQFANDLIREARTDPSIQGRMPDEHAYLTLDEVLSIRLYTGPAYQPINGFLRELSKLSGNLKKEMAYHTELTYIATVGQICNGIRKLAAIADEETMNSKVYRGVRGKLPKSFFTRDNMGIVCATDAAFMSTSTEMHAPIKYMAPDCNVMWEMCMEPPNPNHGLFHSGADVSILSQFAGEKEVLFPPYTMMQLHDAKGNPADPLDAVYAAHEQNLTQSGEKGDETHLEKMVRWASGAQVEFVHGTNEEETKQFLKMVVTPMFI